MEVIVSPGSCRNLLERVIDRRVIGFRLKGELFMTFPALMRSSAVRRFVRRNKVHENTLWNDE